MKYREAITKAMEMLAEDERTIFLGYNIVHGSRGYGTLSKIPVSKCIETPVAENLMTGLSMGLSLVGYRPLLFFERHDFMLNAFDSIFNHLNLVETISEGQYRFPVIIRATVGGTKPIYPGQQHIKDLTKVFKENLGFPVYDDIGSSQDVLHRYREALNSNRPAMFIEKRDRYDLEIG